MTQRASLSRSLFAVLVLVCSMATFTLVPAPRGSYKSGSDVFYVRLLHTPSFSYSFRHKKFTARNSHIKVRYMGGDCSYHPLFLMYRHVAEYGKLVTSGSPVTFVLPIAWFSFKLRGPPANDRMMLG